MGQTIGIDLGTTYSVVAAIDRSGLPKVLHNRDGENITPSVVLFDNDEIVVGTPAKRQASASPLDVVQFIKRQMGNPDFVFIPEWANTTYRPEQISALIVKYLVEDAASALGEPVTDAVITVPAYFDEAQRNATRQAGQIAGVNVLGIVNEPTAAAVSFGLANDYRGTLLVFDLGGGTFDVTVMHSSSGGSLEVLATGGDRNLGGYDFDNEIINWAAKEFVEQGGPLIVEDSVEGAQLRERAEEAKRSLSIRTQVQLYLTAGGRNAKLALTRDQFESMTTHLLTRCEYLVEEVVESAGLTYGDLDKVLLVGGSTRMPMVRDMVERVVGCIPDTSSHPDEAVALGAAIVAELRRAEAQGTTPEVAGGDTIRVEDVVSHGLGVVANNDQGMPANTLIIAPNTRIPCQVVADHFTTVLDDQTSLLVQVTEGDEDDVDPRYVRLLGKCPLKLQPRPAGSPIRIVFSCDLDGILHIEVIDLIDGRNLGEMEIDRGSTITPLDLETFRHDMAGVELQ